MAALWSALIIFAVVVTTFILLMAKDERRPSSASRETTTRGATIERGEPGREGDELVGAAGRACDTHAACSDGALCTRGRCAPITERTTECRDVLIRFARGATELSSFAEAELEKAARCVEAGRAPALAIEPSDDPSRSTEANDDVTAARVEAVRKGLERRGVTGERLEALLRRR